MARRDELIQVAEQTPFDNGTNGFNAEDVQGAIEEIGASASVGTSMSRAGNQSGNTYLKIAGGVSSNRAGALIPINNAIIDTLVATNENLNTYDVRIYTHEGDAINLTLIATLSVVNARNTIFSNLNIPVTQNLQVAIRTKGVVKNPAVSFIVKGSA